MGNAKLKEFIFKGTLELRGVVFTVKAVDRDAAQAKATRGDYDDYDTRGAEAADWQLDLRSCESND